MVVLLGGVDRISGLERGTIWVSFTTEKATIAMIISPRMTLSFPG